MPKTSQYPEVPPGVMMFDPRRFRRHARKVGMIRANYDMQQKVKEAQAQALNRGQKAATAATLRQEAEAKADRYRRLFIGAVVVVIMVVVALFAAVNR